MNPSIFDKIKEYGIDSYAVDIRSHLHQHPELSDQEYNTRDYICQKLEEIGVEYKTGFAGTGIVAEICGDPSGPVIALRADMDALPIQENNPDLACRSVADGVMHACGHDIHTAVLLGTASYFSKTKDSLPGTIKLLFQPAEEGDGGAQRMIDEGCLDSPHVDAVLGLHVEPSLPTGSVGIRYGKMYASSDVITLKIHGISSHGANPELGVDAIVIAANIINNVQALVSRNIGPTNSAVCTFGTIHGGNVENQVADYVELHGIIRTLDPETRSFMREHVNSICESTAQMMGGKAELLIRPSYSPLINDDHITEIVHSVASEILGEDSVVLEDSPLLSVEDFAYFAEARPACFYHLGCTSSDNDSLQVLHNPDFNPDPSCIAFGIAMQVSSVLKIMNQ